MKNSFSDSCWRSLCDQPTIKMAKLTPKSDEIFDRVISVSKRLDGLVVQHIYQLTILYYIDIERYIF